MELDDIFTEPYDVEQNEPRPDSVVYTEIFKELQSHGKRAVALLREPLAESGFQNVITSGLLREIVRRTKHEDSEQVMFAVAGDMKAGKSSVINSILSIGTIARKGDGGDSCTWVVQRYMKMFPSQTSPFAAKVHFFNKKQIHNIVASLLAKFYRAVNKEDKEEEDDDDFDQQMSNVESFGEIRDTISAFMALFCDKEEFENEATARKFLKSAKSENDETMIRALVEMAHEVVQDRLDGKEVVTVETSTTEELLWALQPYTYQIGGIDGDGVVSPWPLVSVIDFGLDHPLLKEGIVFVDSPGLSDANAARSQNAIKHHRKCTHKIAVADIGRAEADANLRQNLEFGFRTRGSGKTILVLTHGDSIDPDTEVTGTPSEKKCVANLDKEVKELKLQKTKKLQQHSRARPEERDDIYEEAKSIGSSLKKKLVERDAIKLEMRNRKVIGEMQKLYRNLTQDPKALSVFAVGNKVYSQYQAGFSDDDKPYLSVKQTSIPELRHRLYTMPVEGKLNETLHFAEIQLPSLINTVELYCSQQHMARKGEIEAIVLEPKNNVRAIVHSVLEGLKEQASKTILHPMKHNETEWIKAARKICRDWTNKYNGKLAILKKDGYEKGKKGAQEVNWNAELSQIGLECLDDAFQGFQKASFSWASTLAADLTKLCNSTRDNIKRDRQFYTMALDPFLKNIGLKTMEFDRKLEATARKLSREVGSLHEKAVMQHNDSYIATAMKQVYKEALAVKGRGAPKKRSELVERHVTKRDGIWLKVHDQIDSAFDVLFKKYEDGITEGLEGLFDGLHADFLFLCKDTEAKDEKAKVQEEILRSQLKENLAKVKEMADAGGVIPDLVARCKAYAQTTKSQLFVH